MASERGPEDPANGEQSSAEIAAPYSVAERDVVKRNARAAKRTEAARVADARRRAGAEKQATANARRGARAEKEARAAAKKQQTRATKQRSAARAGGGARVEQQLAALVRALVIPPERADDALLTGQRFGLHSQFEEDGILLALHAAIGAGSRRFVELGCGDNGGNSGMLAAELGWHGLMVDADANAVATTVRLNPQKITGTVSWITRENVDDVLTSNGFSGEVDQLSIDLDGNDYWILERLTAVRPRVLIMEYNSAFGPNARVTVPYDDGFRRPVDSPLGRLHFGASLGALTDLAARRGYGLVAVEPTGANAFFLADGLAPELPRHAPEALYRTLSKHRAAVAAPDLFAQMATAGLSLVDLTDTGGAGPSAPLARASGDRGAARRNSRDSFFTEARAHAPLVGVDTKWGSFVVATSDETVGRSLFAGRRRGEMRLLTRAVEVMADSGATPRGLFVDCGANIGTTLIPAVLTAGFNSAIGFEPHPGNVRLLRANVALNGLEECVVTVPAAVSERAGTVELLVHPTNSGGHEVAVAGRTASPTLPDEPLEHVSVEAVTVDGTFEARGVDPAGVGMVWLDVQGHEAAALSGAEGVLRHGPPVVFEFYPAMLRHAGGYDRLIDLAAEQYTHVLDLRTVGIGDGGPAWRPVAELDAIGKTYGAGADRVFTDVLLVRR
ncbi:MAG: FkbM family methyltransferase [Solirubrobacteraceae bacterium]